MSYISWIKVLFFAPSFPNELKINFKKLVSRNLKSKEFWKKSSDFHDFYYPLRKQKKKLLLLFYAQNVIDPLLRILLMTVRHSKIDCENLMVIYIQMNYFNRISENLKFFWCFWVFVIRNYYIFIDSSRVLIVRKWIYVAEDVS